MGIQENNEWIDENKEEDKLSIYSDNTQIINLNEQLLNIIKLDNNQQLIEWLIQNDDIKLFQFIDQRLMISLIYRITQLIKTNKYINDICQFLKKEFVFDDQQQIDSFSFSLPNPLKTEFLNSLNELKEHETIKQCITY